MKTPSAVPSYAYHHGIPGMMPDTGPALVAPDRGGRTTKRRRIDGSIAEDGVPGPTTEGYDHTWNNAEPHPQQVSQQQTFGSASGRPLQQPYTTRPSAEYSNRTAVAASLTGEGSSQWQQHDPAAYPELASCQQQPYFYQQSDSGRYNSQWPSTESQTYSSAAPTATRYSVGEQAGSSAMPFFPPSSTVGSAGMLGNATVATFNYADAEQANDFDSTSNPAALSREIAKAQSSSFYFDDASMHLKNQSLPILENLATQLIHTISRASFPQIQDMMRDDTEDSQAYKTLKNLFDQTRKVYSRETPFIDAIAIQMFQPTQQEIIRKANIATFISSILGAHDVSFFHLNEFYMETFVPLGHRLLKWQGAIYLELKTQTYISALMNSDGRPEEMLDELFPPDLDAQILTRHPDAPSLSPSEQDFIDRSRARRSYLLAEPSTRHALKELPKKYQWTDFVREFASCISKNVDGIMNVPVRSQTIAGGKVAAAADATNGQGTANGSGNGAIAAVQNLTTNGQAGSKGASGEGRKSAANASTVRQPWTKHEEDALLNGLERVNGPHWSQILALYGRGGSVSEVLKDRNQVQLKDKARNLKLWYLKTGKDVPLSLRGVTGELRKRGGARARAALGVAEDDEAGGGADGEDGDNADQDASGRRGSKKKTKKS